MTRLVLRDRPSSAGFWFSPVPLVALGGRRIGDGALEGFAECKLSVRNGPRNGLVDGVNAMSWAG